MIVAFLLTNLASAWSPPTAPSVRTALSAKQVGTSHPLSPPTEDTKWDKVERLKYGSNMLRQPVANEFEDHERIFVSHDAYQILKYHGSYQQDDRERRKEAKKAGLDKYYQFMLRLKVPAGEVPAELYRLLDDMATEMGQNDLRATTRQAWQMHGILKGNMKAVIARIMKAGSSTVG